jgi:nucleoside 2-deoxyribosyltransferase/predicted secreted protein
MYVLCSPCVLNPGLRADGITRPSDIELFQRSIERCEQFFVEMVPLPCPETLYLGPGRQPGTFLDRLNTPAFSALMDKLEEDVHRIIQERGPPLCIIGVNSSPTCGVTSTYYGSIDGLPPKRGGRGVFLSRFPEIPAIDVSDFACYRVYLAAPLFSEAERAYNKALADLLEKNLFKVHLPQEAGDDTEMREKKVQEQIFSRNKKSLEDSDRVVAIIDGADADSGTSWEMGYAYALNKPVIALRTDFRRVGTHERVNLMLEESATIVTGTRHLLDALHTPLPAP